MKEDKINYAVLIFASIDTVKRLLVREIKAARIGAMISCEELDKAIGLDSEWPRMKQIEENPELLTCAFLQEVSWIDDPLVDKISSALSGCFTVQPMIHSYLVNHPDILAHAQEWAGKSLKFFHGTNYGPDPEKYIEGVLDGKPQKEVHPNCMTPQEYAEAYVFFSVLYGLDECVSM